MAEDAYVPELPPGFKRPDEQPKTSIGPSLPPGMPTHTRNDDDDDYVVGPSLPGDSTEATSISSTVEMIEARAKAMRDKIAGPVCIGLLLFLFLLLINDV